MAARKTRIRAKGVRKVGKASFDDAPSVDSGKTSATFATNTVLLFLHTSHSSNPSARSYLLESAESTADFADIDDLDEVGEALKGARLPDKESVERRFGALAGFEELESLIRATFVRRSDAIACFSTFNSPPLTDPRSLAKMGCIFDFDPDGFVFGDAEEYKNDNQTLIESRIDPDPHMAGNGSSPEISENPDISTHTASSNAEMEDVDVLNQTSRRGNRIHTLYDSLGLQNIFKRIPFFASSASTSSAPSPAPLESPGAVKVESVAHAESVSSSASRTGFPYPMLSPSVDDADLFTPLEDPSSSLFLCPLPDSKPSVAHWASTLFPSESHHTKAALSLPASTYQQSPLSPLVLSPSFPDNLIDPSRPSLSLLVQLTSDDPTRFRELRTLLTEGPTSKFASESRLGQSKLYDACETVLLKLIHEEVSFWKTRFPKEVWINWERSNSWPYQSKVKGVDGYYKIIKRPMEMAEMHKKLKTEKYNSKNEFVRDLELIWNNCLLFNQADNNPWRQCGLYLQSRTRELVESIPNVEVQIVQVSESDDERELVELSFVADDVPHSNPKIRAAVSNSRPRPRPRPRPGPSGKLDSLGINTLGVSEVTGLIGLPGLPGFPGAPIGSTLSDMGMTKKPRIRYPKKKNRIRVRKPTVASTSLAASGGIQPPLQRTRDQLIDYTPSNVPIALLPLQSISIPNPDLHAINKRPHPNSCPFNIPMPSLAKKIKFEKSLDSLMLKSASGMASKTVEAAAAAFMVNSENLGPDIGPTEEFDLKPQIFALEITMENEFYFKAFARDLLKYFSKATDITAPFLRVSSHWLGTGVGSWLSTETRDQWKKYLLERGTEDVCIRVIRERIGSRNVPRIYHDVAEFFTDFKTMIDNMHFFNSKTAYDANRFEKKLGKRLAEMKRWGKFAGLYYEMPVLPVVHETTIVDTASKPPATRTRSRQSETVSPASSPSRS